MRRSRQAETWSPPDEATHNRAERRLAPGTTRRRALMMVPFAGALMWSRPGSGETYPSRPIHVVVPFGAGTTTDLLARQVTETLGQVLGQRLVLENRAGAGGSIGTESAARAEPDGYTLLWGTGQTQAVNVSLYRNIKYDPVADFAPIAKIASQPLVLVVHPDVPARTVGELVALAKKQPDALSFASTGNGSSPHLAGATFSQATGAKLLHVPYNGAQVFQDLLTGRVNVMFYPYLPLKSYIEAGKLIPLATTGTARLRELPQAPTIVESGQADFVIAPWYALYAPAGTPSAVIDRLNAAVKIALEDNGLRGRLAGTGTNIEFMTPAELTAFTASEIVRSRELVKAAGATVN